MPAVPERKLAILLVDDNQDDVYLIKHALENTRLNYPVVTVPGALEAFAYLSRNPPYHDESRYPRAGLVLLDIRMPGIDGFEVLRWIRHNAQLAGLPVVMLTGAEEVELANRAYQLGANSFFVKAFDFGNYQELFRTVKRFITS